MATQVDCDDEDDAVGSPLADQREPAQFQVLLSGEETDITALALPGAGPWEFSAGRDAARDIVINSASVSGHHADICTPGPPSPAPKP